MTTASIVSTPLRAEKIGLSDGRSIRGGDRRVMKSRDLAKEADEILEGAGCDTMTGAKIDQKYRRNKRAENKRLGRHRRARRKKLGKFGAASPVRNIPPDGC
jgi:hypothetical protein